MTDCSCDLGEASAARETAEGYEIEIPADRFQDAVRFVENERRCCAHLAFSLTRPTRGAPLLLRVTGPGATEALRALVAPSGPQ